MNVFDEQLRVNLGSTTVPPAPTLVGAPQISWFHESGRSKGRYVALAGSLAVVGVHGEQPTWDYYEDIDFQTQVIDLVDGVRRWHRDDCVPRGVVEGVVVVSPPGSGELEGHALETGSSLWKARLPGDHFKLVEGSIYSWRDNTLYQASWADPNRAPEAPTKRQLELVSDVRRRDGLVLVTSWRAKPQVTVFHRVWRGEQAVWEWDSSQAGDSDVLLDEHGWVLRTSQVLEGYSGLGERLWAGPGYGRCWMSPSWVVGVDSHEQLWAVERLTGQRHPGPACPGGCWEVTISGDSGWLVERRTRMLTGFRLRGEVFHRERQPEGLGTYGINRLYPWNGGLIAAGDGGNLAFLTV
ncbi:MAG: hypothetical protein AB7S38_29475 [Vulcanimicrobiota bacterium]